MVDMAVRQADPANRVGWTFVAMYTAAYMSISLMLIAPLLVTLALKIHGLVGSEQAPKSLALVAGTGSLLSLFANPIFGKLSDRTVSSWGMRRPWMLVGLAGGTLGILTVALAPSIAVVLVGWCLAQVFFSALQAALVAVLPDQVPSFQRGMVSGILGICVPIASVTGTFLVRLFAGNQLAMFLAPCAIGSAFILLFAASLRDRRLLAARRPPWSLRELAGTFSVSPRKHPDFAWVFVSRFLFMSAYAFLTGYQAFYLLSKLGTPEGQVPRQIFLATLAQSVVVVAASVVGGKVSDWTGRRKPFVLTASAVYGAAMLLVATADTFGGFLVAVALSGLGFGMYIAVDLALVTDVLPDRNDAAKDMGVFNIASALPFAVAPAAAPAILAFGQGSYTVLYAVAGGCAVLGAFAILPVRGVR